MAALEIYAFGLAVASAIGGMAYRTSRRNARIGQAWREAARLAGLTEVVLQTSPLRLDGCAGTRRVRFEGARRRKGHERPLLVVQVAPGIGLRPETWDTALEKAVGIRELQTGDEAFDRDVHVQGPPEVLRSALDAETRGLLRDLVRGWRLSVHERQALVALPAAMVEEPRHLAALLKDLLELAQRLDRPEDVAVRIAENLRREPEWRVRLESLLLLVERFPSHAATQEALERARSDEHPEVRLRAALASGDAGLDTLREMAFLGPADDAHAARAILALGDRLPPQDAEGILGRALRARQVQAAMACLDRLGRAGPAAVALLEKVLAVEDGALAVAAARALGATGASAAEAPLLRALAQAAADVVATAAEALGRVGSTAAVLPLKEAGEREGADARLRRAARQAVAEIQSRLQGASPGQLSIAGAEAGHLSLADEGSAGRVSLADRDAAR